MDDLRVEPVEGRWRVTIDEVYPTSTADLWSACTEPGRLARWMATYRGELRLGGRWEALADGEVWGTGTVTSCAPLAGFTTTWEVEGEPTSTVVVRLEEAPSGTRLLLVHDGVVDPVYPPGWSVYLGMLREHVEDGTRTDLGAAAFGQRLGIARERFAARLTALGLV